MQEIPSAATRLMPPVAAQQAPALPPPPPPPHHPPHACPRGQLLRRTAAPRTTHCAEQPGAWPAAMAAASGCAGPRHPPPRCVDWPERQAAAKATAGGTRCPRRAHVSQALQHRRPEMPPHQHHYHHLVPPKHSGCLHPRGCQTRRCPPGCDQTPYGSCCPCLPSCLARQSQPHFLAAPQEAPAAWAAGGEGWVPLLPSPGEGPGREPWNLG